MAGWMSHADTVSKRIKLSSNFFLSHVAPPLWFSNTAYGFEILTGRGACHSGGLLKTLNMAVLFDPVRRFVNPPSTYDRAVLRRTSCRYVKSNQVK